MIRLALVAVMLAGCGQKDANRSSCYRSLAACTTALEARGCAPQAQPATSRAMPSPDAGTARPGLNLASCVASERVCVERLAQCPPPPAPAARRSSP